VTRIAIRGLFARRLRSALTALAVLLGVTMISGTFVLTDTIKAAFDDLFTAQNRGADAIVSAKKAVDSDFTRPPALDATLLDRIKALPEVAEVAGQLNDVAALVGKDGKVVSGNGAPTIAATYMPPPFTAIEVNTGRPPAGPDEIALDAETAKEQGFKVGDRVKVAAGGPIEEFDLVGLATFGSENSIGGATVIVFDLPTAQQLFDKVGKVDFAFVAARDKAKAPEVIRAIAGVLPPDAQVRSSAEEAKALSDDIGDALSGLTTGLLAFGFIAVLVGAFLIFNTFSITIAQRTRELALLRMLGASRRQVLGSVLAEALLLGTLGAVLGLFAGFGFAKGIEALFGAIGLDLPSTAAVIKSRTVIACLSTGIVVTLLGAVGPALRATRVSPIEALREGAAPPRRTFGSRVAPYLGGLLMLVGAGLVMTGLLADGGDADAKLISAAGGSVVLVLGVALLSPALVRPAAGIVAWPFTRTTKLVGRLARENATRNPGRTAVTAAALMVGLAVVLFVTVFANGLRVRTENLLDQTFAGDLAVLHEDGFSTIPAGTAAAVAAVDGVAAVSPVKGAEGKVVGKPGDSFGSGIDPSTLLSVYRFDWAEGDDGVLGTLGKDDVLLEEGTAEKSKVKAGDTVRMRGVREGRFTVRGVYRDDGILGAFALPTPAFDSIFAEPRITAALVDVAPGRRVADVQAGVDTALKAFPEARARDQAELEKETGDQINQILGLFYALLAMSILISAVGIVNTLSLSIHERTRELGLLRAVGMTQRDVRRMVRYESVITSAFGAVLGLVLGLFFAFVVTQALKSEGLAFSLPLGQIVTLLLFSLLVGVGAAVLPARRAAKLDVLKAISYE
jgi:putative ABC transport system permease protein